MLTWLSVILSFSNRLNWAVKVAYLNFVNFVNTQALFRKYSLISVGKHTQNCWQLFRHWSGRCRRLVYVGPSRFPQCPPNLGAYKPGSRKHDRTNDHFSNFTSRRLPTNKVPPTMATDLKTRPPTEPPPQQRRSDRDGQREKRAAFAVPDRPGGAQISLQIGPDKLTKAIPIQYKQRNRLDMRRGN